MNIDELIDQYNKFVEACNQHHAVDDVMEANKILAQIYEYAKQLEAQINVMKSCASCKHNNWWRSPICEECRKNGKGKYSNWEFNPGLLKGNDNEI